jgi:glycosyltransferase involved in cell wall biosynthesis
MSDAAAPGRISMRRFTILLAARDRLALLEEAVSSALAQEGVELEVLVVDDGSGPECAAWLDEAARREPRLRVIHQPHRGVGAARACGVRAAAHEHVTVLDSDDRLLPGALRRVGDFLEAHPDTDLLYADHVHELPGGRETVTTYRPFASNREMLRSTLLSPRVPFKHSGTTFLRDVSLELGNYDDQLGFKVDIEFFLRFLAAGRRVRHLPGGPAVSFRTHGASMSRSRLRGIRAWWTIVDRYGPKSALLRLGIKLARAAFELAKAAYTALFWRER